jgi:hypothetical protein
MSPLELLSRRSFLVAAISATGLAGCAPFKTPDDLQTKLLPKPRLAPDSVILEIGYAQVPLKDSAIYDEVWMKADEQSLALALRQELERNGMRFGILGKEIPEKVRAIMDNQRQDLDRRSEDLNMGDVEVDRQTRRLQCRTARRATILCSKRYDQLVLLKNENGAIGGRPLQQAQCLFGLKPYPHGDGRVKLDLLPEVEHGEMQRQFVAGEGTLMQRVGRDKVTFEALRISLSLSPGQMIVASATSPPRGLGGQFFVEPVAGTPSRSLVFVRLAHTQQDNLFAPELSAPALATPGD